MECTYWVIQSLLCHWLGRFAPTAVILIGEFSPHLFFNYNQTEIYYILIYKDYNNFFLWNLTVYFEILNFKIGKKYYISYIIHNVLFWPHWVKLFSNWPKYNIKPSLNTKWCQISMECFHFSEQRFPCICLNKVPIASVQHFILAIPDYCLMVVTSAV